MKTIINLLGLFLLIANLTNGQTTIKGKVLDEKGKALPGANVSLKGTYDGASTNAEGNFRWF